MNWLRSLYDWVLHWSTTPYAMPALCLLALAEASFFPIPPDVLLITMGLAAPRRALYFAFWTTVFSVTGGILGYSIGLIGWEFLSPWFFSWIPGFTPEAFSHIQNMYQQWDFWVVFTAGFTPVPFKLITITAGTFQINFPLFVTAALLSRGLRFYILSFLIYRYGKNAKQILDRHFNRFCWGALAILIGAAIIWKLLF